uniref:Monocarboxylate transporter 12-like n=1 Tax=Phallusia mammillata TaxID=59560 RepID=A0A6F9DRP3_9ASCI|nr:monocarboxylate transporter 12-like [Phallusia mammillata]
MICKIDVSSVMLLLCGLYAACLWGSTLRCYSLFYDSMVEDFEANYAAASMISSLSLVGCAMGSVFSSPTFKLFGYSNSVMLLGVVSCISTLVASFSSSIALISIGFGLIPGFALVLVHVSTVAISNTFERANFFTQMFFLGLGLGPFLLCPCFQYFIEMFRWRGALQIIAGMFLNITVCGAVLRRFEQNLNRKPSNVKQCQRRERGICHQILSSIHSLLDMKLLANPSFYVYTLSATTYGSVFFSALSYIPLYGTKVLQLDVFVATTLVLALSVGDGFAKVSLSILSDRISSDKMILFTSSLMLLMSFSVLFLSLTRSYIVAMVACTATGLFIGGLPGLRTTIGYNEFAPELFSSVFGYSTGVTLAVSSATQYLIGMLIDNTDNLSLVYYIGAGLGLVSAAIEFSWYMSLYQDTRCHKRAKSARDHQTDNMVLEVTPC